MKKPENLPIVIVVKINRIFSYVDTLVKALFGSRLSVLRERMEVPAFYDAINATSCSFIL